MAEDENAMMGLALEILVEGLVLEAGILKAPLEALGHPVIWAQEDHAQEKSIP